MCSWCCCQEQMSLGSCSAKTPQALRTPQQPMTGGSTCTEDCNFSVEMPQRLGLPLTLCGSAITPSSLLPSSLAGTEAGRATEPALSLLLARWVGVPRPYAAGVGWPWWSEVKMELSWWPLLCSLGQPCCLQPKPAPLPTATPLCAGAGLERYAQGRREQGRCH